MEATENYSVKVAVIVRPLLADERAQGCRECVTVTPNMLQVQIGAHSFTFDKVYGNSVSASPSTCLFDECVLPLVDGLFQGYNATVLAYGQTGSGKTYTMGMGVKDGTQTGLIPRVMNALFNKIDSLKHQTEFRLHVSFIEILKEEVRDLLDSVSAGNGHSGKVSVLARPPIQIRESSNGVISLSGTTEVAVSTLQEMTACLDQGALSRATGTTNMNNLSSRSHAIFTIMLEQMRKLKSVSPINEAPDEDMGEEYFCAKLHLVDLAGSERVKRTGSDGVRLKEGIHINKGLLALGNVISALGDEKKRKEGMHVPYRDSKLTRLLQDSLGGNSRTAMLACISPADINAEETLSTLKYANRARNIQNKPVVNRDFISDEVQQLRKHVKYLEAALSARQVGPQPDELQVLKERIAYLEAANENLSRELHKYRSQHANFKTQHEITGQDEYMSGGKSDGHKRDFHSMNSFGYALDKQMSGESYEVYDDVAKEWEHVLLQGSMDKELNELNKHLAQKESEMKLLGGAGALIQHSEKKIMELEEEKRIIQQERDRLLVEIENLGANSEGQTQKTQVVCVQKLKALETQILDLKKQESQVELLKKKEKSDEAAKRLQSEIQFIKAQKVQLQHKIKQEAEQFRWWKTSREKELLQLRKEGRRNAYERHKLEALYQRQKMVLQRKTEEAALATKRLKELLEARKSTSENLDSSNGRQLPGQGSDSQRWVDNEIEVMVNVHEVHLQYEKQRQEQAMLKEELALLKQMEHFPLDGHSPPKAKSGNCRLLPMSPNARTERMDFLENILKTSSDALTAMASQLSEAAERGQSCGQWSQFCSLGEAKDLLQYLAKSVIESRCQLLEKDKEINYLKRQLDELLTLLQDSEAKMAELLKEQNLIAITLASSSSGSSCSSLKRYADDLSGPLYPTSLPTSKQLKFSPGIANGCARESVAFLDETSQMVPFCQLPLKKLVAVGQNGKLWRWKRSHHQWLVQFKWKWQKPWKLSELIKHSDETIMRSRPHSQALVDVI